MSKHISRRNLTLWRTAYGTNRTLRTRARSQSEFWVWDIGHGMLRVTWWRQKENIRWFEQQEPTISGDSFYVFDSTIRQQTMGAHGSSGREGHWAVGVLRCANGVGWQGEDQKDVCGCLHEAHLLHYLRIQLPWWHVVNERPYLLSCGCCY